MPPCTVTKKLKGTRDLHILIHLHSQLKCSMAGVVGVTRLIYKYTALYSKVDENKKR